METPIRVNGKTIKEKEKANFYGLMAILIKDNGLIIKNMVKVNIQEQMGISIKDSGEMIKYRVIKINSILFLGTGKFYWANGNTYEGDWLENQREGFGTSTKENNEKYIG
jgi:hypothetical protein